MKEIFGIIGGVGFAISATPTAYKAYKTGHTEFIPTFTQWSVFIASFSMWIYLTMLNGFNWIIAFNHILNIICWGTVLRYQYFPRRKV